MTDLHTHILPAMDDGAPDLETALAMLAAQARQGVDTVALTPHFYRSREHVSDFLARREEAMAQLKAALGGALSPELILAAEVAYAPGMADWPELGELCYAGTKLLLVELPFTAWNDELFRQLYAIEGRRGITPVIAHAERYFGVQSKAYMAQLLETGFPLQVNASSLLRFATRGKVLKLLANFGAILSSDCHNLTTRPPDLAATAALLHKKLGSAAAKIMHRADDFTRW